MRRLLTLFLNCILIFTLTLSAPGMAWAQDGGENAFVAGLLQRMSPEVKIGQLFVVAFDGPDTAETSAIADLILNDYVGGVILSADHGNIVDSGDPTPAQVAQLTSALQTLATQAGTSEIPFIPLFIALEQEGGGPAYSEIVSGLTPQPSPMALGATWNPENALEVGRVVGAELATLGINFLLGPALDLLTQPDPNGGDAGIRSFGGDPYWVGKLAGAYVQGLREGSLGRIAVALKHFPGEGGFHSDSDTIDKSLDQLRQIDLQPYLNLMQAVEGQPRALADAVLTTHARFRGFSGLRERTKPISVDEMALGALLQQPEITAWRDAGGLVVSGSLGANELRRYFDPSLATFPSAEIALQAFLAGNDLLVLNDFSLNRSAAREAETIKATIELFRQRYSEDLDFQQRVDRAVTRILRLKYRLYPGFVPGEATVDPDTVDARLRLGLPIVERVARDAVTRIYPIAGAEPPPAPAPGDSFLIFTDDRPVVDCSRCPERTTLFTHVISQTLTGVAGVPADRVGSYGFNSLKAFLAGAPTAPNLTELFAQANWIILAQQTLQSDVQQSDAARLLLRTRPELLANKRVVLFTFGPPYEITAEDLNRLTAHYALYSNATPFVEAAVAALFGQLQPTGASPVSIAAIDYDLTRQTEPDPNQTIRLAIGEAAPGPGTPTPESPNYRVGSDLLIRTEMIVDRNGNPVPDGTPVQFRLIYRDAGDATDNIDAWTLDGVAEIVTRIKNNGRLAITAMSEPALNSDGLQVTISEQGPPVIETIARPTSTPTLPPTSTPTRAPTATPSPTPVGQLESLLGAEPRRATLIDFVASLLGIVLVEAWGYRMKSKRKNEAAIERAVRLMLWGALCGLIAYTGYALGLPGADILRATFGSWAALIVTLIGAAGPWVVDRMRRL
ncbi:MAG TPA: glycoside hydrolase family 3 N-terminal domain-containing protein [Anaerolineae bacterium]|nr:glycoside hydrolase family 3 N-terminal domain-containing protein [Anaerolineae bacterium]